MNAKTWRFQAQDTLFFRESRPMEAIGGSELASVFPPPARTTIGAIRTAMGDGLGVDWRRFASDRHYGIDGLCLRDEVGFADDLGRLSFSGPWLSRQTDGGWQRLYPVPGNILGKMTGHGPGDLVRLHIGPPLHCDLGDKVRLPVLPEGYAGYKPLEDYWLTLEGFGQVLVGEVPDPGTLVSQTELYEAESRLGIARNNRQRTVERGLLYQTRHIRPKSGVAVEMDVWGGDPRLHPSQTCVRLGGEGRVATVTVAERVEEDIPAPQLGGDAHGLVLILLAPVLSPGAEVALLPGFTATEKGGVRCWKGKVSGVPLTLWSAITGRALREGGWDLANRRPRAVQSLIPVGSLFYCTVDNGDIQAAIDAIHLQWAGDEHERKLGRGLLAAGLWKNNEITG